MYQRIATYPGVVEIYADRLIKEGVFTDEEVKGLHEKFRSYLEEEFAAGETYRPNRADWLDGRWSDIGFAEDVARRGTTHVDLGALKEVGRKLTAIPENFTAHKTLKRIMAQRRKMIDDGHGIDWAMAEALAYGTLLIAGTPFSAIV